MDELRTTYKIDDLVSECTNDLETVIAVTKWVTNLWEHDGNNVPMDNNPLYILDQVINHGERYRCVEYGTVIEAVLDSLDYQARQIYLKTSDVETREYGAGHVGCEVYLKDYNKWVFIDGQFGTIVTLQGIPLNSYEIRAALDSKAEGLDVIWVNDEKATDADDKMYYEWIYEYLFYLDVAYPKNDKAIKLMLVPKTGRAVTIFQIKYPLDYDYYISNIDDFYPGQKTQVLYQ